MKEYLKTVEQVLQETNSTENGITNEEAAKESAADENDEDLEAKAGEDSPQDDFTQPDGFTDLTSGTFMEGQEDFSVDF